MVETVDASVLGWTALTASTAVILVISFLVPVAIAAVKQEKRKRTETHESTSTPKASAQAEGQRHRHAREDEDDDTIDSIEKEPWAPKIETNDWQQASELPGCPWNFDGCADVSAALDRIWRPPLNDMQRAIDVLRPRVSNIRISRVVIPYPRKVHFAAVYTLSNGAELFGGGPIEHTVGIDLGGSDCESSDSAPSPRTMSPSGLRRRRLAAPPKSPKSEAVDIPLPCLGAFYRIHDGFGVLVATNHLPLLLADPSSFVHGSCYYVYPLAGLESVPLPRWPYLVKFGRVDQKCAACANLAEADPGVVYVERTAEPFADEETPLEFVCDTVSNISGQRVAGYHYQGCADLQAASI